MATPSNNVNSNEVVDLSDVEVDKVMNQGIPVVPTNVTINYKVTAISTFRLPYGGVAMIASGQDAQQQKRKNTSFKITNVLPSRPPSNDPEDSGEEDTEDISENVDQTQPVQQQTQQDILPHHQPPTPHSTTVTQASTSTTQSQVHQRTSVAPSAAPSLTTTSNMPRMDRRASLERKLLQEYMSHIGIPNQPSNAPTASLYLTRSNLPHYTSISMVAIDAAQGPKDRFKVVKIDASEPCRRDRWTNIDFADRPNPFLSSAESVVEILEEISQGENGSAEDLESNSTSHDKHRAGIAANGNSCTKLQRSASAAAASSASRLRVQKQQQQLQSQPQHQPQAQAQSCQNCYPQQNFTAVTSAALQPSQQQLSFLTAPAATLTGQCSPSPAKDLAMSKGLMLASFCSASGTNQGAIDNRIEQAMDLVKSHLMNAVRSEVEELKEKIIRLEETIASLQVENDFLRSNASNETLTQLQQHHLVLQQQQIQMQSQQQQQQQQSTEPSEQQQFHKK